MKRKNVLSAILFLSVMLLTFYAVFSKNDIRSIQAAVKGMRPLFLVFSLASAVFFVAMEGFMIWYLLRSFQRFNGSADRPAGGGPGLLRCIGYSFIGFFFSGITPSATGGQPAQLYYMKKDRTALSDGTLALMTVAVLYKFVLVLIGAVILLFWREGLRSYLGGYMGLFYLGIFLNALLVALLLLVMLHGSLMERLIAKAERLLTKIHILRPDAERQAAIHRMIAGYQGTLSYLVAHKGSLLFLTFCTFLQRNSLFFMTWLIYRGLHLEDNGMLLVMVIQASVYIAVDMLPLPGSQGISELMYHTVFSLIFPGGTLAASMCVSRGIGFYLLLVIGGIVTLVRAAVLRRTPKNYEVLREV